MPRRRCRRTCCSPGICWVWKRTASIRSRTRRKNNGSPIEMRELFDQVAGNSPLDPHEPVRRTTRGPQRKRFYRSAGVIETPEGFAIALDGKPVRTPSGKALIVPAGAVADAIVAEWGAQKEIIDPTSMPLT